MRYYAPAPRAEALSNAFVWLLSVWRLSVWRLSVAYIGPKSRTERPRKTKISTEVAHVTRTPLSRSKGQGHQAGLLTAAFTHRQIQRSGWERIERGKLLLRCHLQVHRSAQQREALRRPHGKEWGGGISCRHAHSLFNMCSEPNG